METGCLNDQSFGPSVRGCRDDFDFTLAFERVFFAILPGSVLIASCLLRLAYLFPKPRIVSAVGLQCAKLAATTAYAALQFSAVLLVTITQSEINGLSVAAAAVPLVAAISMLPLSFAEHSRNPRPSFVLSGYLVLTLILDIAQVRTSWLLATSPRATLFARLFTSSIATKLIILLLEAHPKVRWLKWNLDEHSPEEVNGLFDMGIYGWLNRLFARGYATVLSLSDLYPLDSNMATEALYPKLERELQSPNYRSGKLSLAKSLAKALLVPWLLPVPPRLCLIGFKFSQPLFLQSLLGYLGTPDDSERNIGYGLIGAAALIYLGIAVSTGFYRYYKFRAIYMVRSCLCAAMYKKSTEARATVGSDAAALTLMSTDIERIIRGFNAIHELWSTVIEVAIACWLLHGHLGAAFAAPLVTIFVCSGAIVFVSSYSGKRQRDWMTRIEKRVGLTARTIADIKGLKIAGVVDRVSDTIQGLRAGEIKSGNRWRAIQILAALFANAPNAVSPLFTFAITSRELGTTTIYTSMAYILLVTGPLSLILQQIPQLVAAFACVDRIQSYLEAEPRVDYRRFTHARCRGTKLVVPSAGTLTDVSEKPTAPPSDARGRPKSTSDYSEDPPAAVTLSNCSFGWAAEKMSLKNISTTIHAGKLSMVVGPVASGKSTFCHALLGEVPYACGDITLHTYTEGIGFCGQSPFLLNATLQENVVGFAPFDQAKYDEIIKATRLDVDVSLMPSGHDTNIGSNGIVLSGGQKQRVSLARALYLGSDMVIFDDILSGLDNDTEKEVFARVFGPAGLLRRRGSTAIICTHSIRHLPAADHIIALGTDGTIVEEGSFQDLLQNNMYVQSLGVKASSRSSSIASSKGSTDDPSTPSPPVASPKPKVLQQKLDKARQMGDWKVYSHYFRTSGMLILVFVVALGVIYGFGENFSTVWLGFWSEDKLSRSHAFYLGIFALFRVTNLVWLMIGAVIVLISLVTLSGTTMHANALRTVVKAPLSFYTSTDIGVVTNLFSQDMTIIDGELPLALLNMIFMPFNLIGMAFVIAVATPYLACGYIVLAVVLYFVQKFYLRTSRQLRFLELEAKSPLYSHFIDAIKGISTIRAFAWVPQNITHNTALLDTSQRPAYLFIMIQQWLAVVLQLVVAALAIIVVSLATQLSAAAGFAGASFVTLMNFGTDLMDLIIFYTQLETSIGAVARLRTFGEEVEGEDLEGEDVRPGEEWPEKGAIEIRDVSASYESSRVDAENFDGEKADDEEARRMVLQNLTVSIQPGQKVAVCGRTGSGKSSLFLLLLRLLDTSPPSAENIHIDSVPLHEIHRPTLRKRIIAVPQDPVFLPGATTLLANLDPDNVASESECLDVLKVVNLDGMSNAPVEELSAGQKQLLSLGRAILRRRMKRGNGGILLLDEVGSSVDGETDRMMGEVIQREFKRYTVVIIAHRLGMVRDYFDRVVVLDQGRMVEEGPPRELINAKESRFRGLWISGDHDDSETR